MSGKLDSNSSLKFNQNSSAHGQMRFSKNKTFNTSEMNDCTEVGNHLFQFFAYIQVMINF